MPMAAAALCGALLLGACGTSAPPAAARSSGSGVASRDNAARGDAAGADAVRADVVARLPAAVDAVAAVWGTGSRQPVEVVTDPGARAVGTNGDVAAAFVSAPRPRLVVSSSAWSSLSPVGRDVVLRHELTHLATGGTVGADRNLPSWLVEGAAEWTAWRDVGWPDARVAPELTALVRARRAPTTLPGAAALSPVAPDAAAAYSSAWLAVRELVRRAGPGGLVRLVHRLEQQRGLTLDAALRQTGDTLLALQQRWKAAVSRLR